MQYVQLTEGKVTTWYPCPQDPTDKPGYVELKDDDPLFLTFKKDWEEKNGRPLAIVVPEVSSEEHDRLWAEIQQKAAETQV
jgi:hypothetical protein